MKLEINRSLGCDCFDSFGDHTIIWQGHVVCRVPLETIDSEIHAQLEYIVESDTPESVGEGLGIYLLDPAVDGWDHNFESSGVLGFLGKAGALLCIGIDLGGNFCGEANHVAVMSAAGDVLCKQALDCEALVSEDEGWRSVVVVIAVDSNTCSVAVGGKQLMQDVKLEGIRIPRKLCIGVCAASSTTNYAHICVNDITLVDEDGELAQAVDVSGANELDPQQQELLLLCQELFQEATMHVGVDANEFGLAALFSEHYAKLRPAELDFNEEW